MTPSLDDVHIGLDVGTSEIKAIAYDGGGRVLVERTGATPWSRTPTGASQTTGAALTDAAAVTVAAAVADLESGDAGTDWHGRVASLGVTGMGESGVLLDPHGREAAPVIAWYDARGGAEVAALGPDVAEAFAASTGLRLDAQASVSKLVWGRRAGWQVTPGHRWLSVPEYVAHMLGGQLACEPSLASRTGLLDLDTSAVSAVAIGALGLPAQLLPPMVHAGEEVGRVSHPAADRRLRGAVLVIAGHDHPVAAIGSGATRRDHLFNGAGTADVLLRSVPGTVPAQVRRTLTEAGISVGRHVLAGTSAVLGGVNNGLILTRVLHLVGAADRRARDELDQAALAVPRPVRGVALAGADRESESLGLTIDRDVGPAEVLAAAVDATARGTAALLAVMEAAVGAHGEAVCSGGWARSGSVRAAKRSAIPRLSFSPVTRPGCRGAAALGAVAAAGAGHGGLETLLADWEATAGESCGCGGVRHGEAPGSSATGPARA